MYVHLCVCLFSLNITVNILPIQPFISQSMSNHYLSTHTTISVIYVKNAQYLKSI